MIPSTYWLPRKISSSSFSRLQVVDQACTAAPSAIAATASVTMKTIRMAPDSESAPSRLDINALPYGATTVKCFVLLWKPPPVVVTIASAAQLFDCAALHCAGHVPTSGWNWDETLPVESVVTGDGLKFPASVLL